MREEACDSPSGGGVHEQLQLVSASCPPPQHQQVYFAYGSNLSYTQMRARCTYNPEISGTPLGIARLDGWRWFICERGYANLRRCLPTVDSDYRDDNDDKARDEQENTDADDGDAVYGVIYSMTKPDEQLLDGYEGVDHRAPESRADSNVDRKFRPREQGVGAYNKWYLPVTVTKWVDETARDVFLSDATGTTLEPNEILKALVYVDEYRRQDGPPKFEYIGRMNRGIREAAKLGLPQVWVDKVMRKYIPEVDPGQLAN